MSRIAAIQNAESVLRAVAEYDEIGPDAFLTKYGFGEARSYYLRHNGRLYASKAIVGAAYGYEFGRALTAREFSGGDATVRRKLESLGFEVVQTSHTGGISELRLYESYSRREVRDLLDPTAPFTQSTGVWGLQGIIQLSHTRGDFVFFVTLGGHAGAGGYQDSVSANGVLDWDSQNRQDLDSSEIQQFIRHNPDINAIHLFLRARKGDLYTYFGPLRYLWHDPTSNNPVHFRWEILNWNPDAARRIGVVLGDARPFTPHTLTVVFSPPPLHRRIPETTTRRGRRIDYAAVDEKNRELGLAGERLVVRYERDRLIAAGRHDLAKDVEHVSSTQGDGLGYDVLSFHETGEEIYIEVKTTEGGAATPFYISDNEVRFSDEKGIRYYLYRVFEYSRRADTGKMYVFQPPLRSQLEFRPTLYRASFHSSETPLVIQSTSFESG